MFSKIKSISRRSLAFLLTILMLLSSGIVGTLAATMELVETGAATAINKGDIVWFDNSSKKWSGVTLHVYGGTSEETTWPGIYMTPVDSSNANGLYYWVSTGNYQTCIFSNKGSSQLDAVSTQGDGYVYNGTEWSAVTDNTNYDLLSVLRGEKIMFYIGENSIWNQGTYYLYDSSGNTVTNGVNAVSKDSIEYTVVAAPAASGYKIGHNGYSGSSLGVTPDSGQAFVAGGDNSGATKKLDAYSMVVSLKSSNVSIGSNVDVTETTVPESHFTDTEEILYFYTTDATVSSTSTFTQLTESNGNLVTESLDAGNYYIYPVYYDGYAYTRGDVMPLTVDASKYTVKITNNTDVSASSSLYIDGTEQDISDWKNIELEVTEGSTLVFTIVSDTNKYVSGLTVDGTDYSDDYDNKKTYIKSNRWTVSFDEEITEDRTINITHSANPTITAEYDAEKGAIALYKSGGSAQDFGTVSYKYDYTYTVTANDDYYITKVEEVADDTTTTVYTHAGTQNETYNGTISDVAVDTVIKAYFAQSSHTLTVNQVNGTGTVVYNSTVEHGATAEITITPPEGHSATVTGDVVTEQTFTETTTITTSALTADATVTVTYTPLYYTVTFKNEDGTSTVLTGDYAYGTLISNIEVDTPAKDSTDQYAYAFAGWSETQGGSAIATDFTVPVGGVTLYATYNETVRSYDVTVNGVNGTASATYTNADGDTVTINGTVSVPYGTVLTLVADDPNAFYTTGTWNVENDGTYTVKGEVTLTHTYSSKETKTITITEEGGTGTVTYTAEGYDIKKNDDGTYTAEAGATVTFTFTAPAGYSIASLNDNAEPQYTILTTSLVTSDTAVKIVYEKIPTYTVTASASIEAAGTVTGGATVSYGKSVTLKATVNTGYTFTGWTLTPAEGYKTDGELTSASLTIIPTADVTATANYTANKGTVNFSAGEGGQVTNSGENTVEYPNTITSTASSTTDGYLFAGWTVTSANGTKNTDYKYTVSGNTITVEIITDGVVVNAVANFSTGYKIDAYFLSASEMLDTLTVKENNGTEDKTVYSGTGVGTESFEGVSWNDAGELSFTAGYTDSVTAQFTGENPLTSVPDGKYLVVFNNTLSWSNVYMYSSSTDSNLYEGGKLSTKNFNSPTATLTRLGSTNYWYAIVDSANKYIIFTPDTYNNYNNFSSGSVVYETNWTTEKPVCTPDSDNKVEGTTSPSNGATIYYTTTSSTSGISVSTASGAYEIKDYLYPEGSWCNEEAVWIYDAGTTVTVTFRSKLIKEFNLSKYETAYKAGTNNSDEYSEGWDDYKAAYEAAETAIGSTTEDQDAIDRALETLKTTYNALVQNTNITITLAPGMVDTNYGTYGTVQFVSGHTGEPTTDLTGNIGGKSGNYTGVTKATVTRGKAVTVSATVKNSEYMVEGFIVNGTKFYGASEGTQNVFTASIPFSESAIVIPVYFKDSVRAKDATNVIRIYAQIGDFDKWGDYIAAYTWNNEQFGTWTGQLMIPDDSNDKGMYYTYVDISDIDGITFDNYGNCVVDNSYINGSSRYQAYDYYEFMVLKDYDNITYVLKESDYNSASLGTSPSQTQILNHSGYEVFTNIDGQPTDIYGNVLESTPTKGATEALYIIRQGHMTQDEGEGDYPKGYIGTRTTNEETGETTLTVTYNESLDADYLVNCYVYTGTGKYVGCFKSYELEDLEVLKNSSGRDVDFADIDGVNYTNKPVFVDYEALTPNPESNGHDGGGANDSAKRYDGEWYAYNNDQANFTVEVISALQTAEGEYEFATADAETGLRNEADWGNVNVKANDETSGKVTVSQGTDFTITAGNTDGYNFVGWYKASIDDNGNIVIGDEFTDIRTGTGKATASALFVAVYEEHVEGSIYIRNFAYIPEENVDASKGQSLSKYAPKAQGKGDMTLSTRYVQVTIYDENGNLIAERAKTEDAETPYQDYIENVSTGQKLVITMYTQPNIPQDYVYAWYKQTFEDADGKIVNYEEVAPLEAPFTEKDAGVCQSFTFTYVVGTEIPDDITIYSDVVHQSSDVTITYYYHDRYNALVSYTKAYVLQGTEFKNKMPSYKTIVNYAPYVDDYYKKVKWNLKEDQTDVTKNGTDFYVYAEEDATFTVNLYADGATKTYNGVPYNTVMDVYAKDINSECTDRRGVWFRDMGTDGAADGEYNVEKGDYLLAYGNYLGLVVTDDMSIVYTENQDLIYQVILGDPVYGREQTSDSSGNNVVDKIYVDYIISYMIPHFNGDKIDVYNTPDDTSDDVTLNDDLNNNTPVQIKTLEAAGLTVDYGVVLEMVNVGGLTSEEFETYYDVDAMSDETKEKLDAIIKAKTKGSDAKGQGVWTSDDEDKKLATYFYVYEGNNITNKNRAVKTFAFANTEANQKKYYNVYGYLKITDKSGYTDIYYSNPKTLNIMNESIDNAAN